VSLTSAGGGTARYPAGQSVSVNVVAPHREVGQTACPGKYLNSQMGSIRDQVKSYIPDYSFEIVGPSISNDAPAYAEKPMSVNAQLTASAPWRVVITPMCQSTAARTFSGTSSRISVDWDLKTAVGSWAAPGIYRVSIVASDKSWFRDIEVLPRVYGPAGVCSTNRIAGLDRYATSVAEGRVAFPTSSSVVVVSGQQTDLVDGLVAGPLAYAKNAPVLATPRDGVPPVVADDIRRRQPRTAWIVGGTGVVPPKIETELRSLGVSEIRRLAGADRFATAAAVAKEVRAPGGRVVVASGRSLVDAVAVSGPAARTGRPVLLVEQQGVPAATKNALRTLGAREATVVGGPGVVSEAARQGLGLASTIRLSGTDRYGTAAAVATSFAGSVGVSIAVVASGADENIVDALSGGAMGRLTVLVRPDAVPTVTGQWLSARKPATVRVVGGTGAVSTATARAAHVASKS
jgi:putative cell wall-binding protein